MLEAAVTVCYCLRVTHFFRAIFIQPRLSFWRRSESYQGVEEGGTHTQNTQMCSGSVSTAGIVDYCDQIQWIDRSL